MIEILWHGRGGQGAFTAARLMGAAAARAEGRFALAFPSFGPERRGAPMRAFTKISEAPIGDRSAISCADYVVYLDETLFAAGWDDELRPRGCVLVNSCRSAADLQRAFPASRDVRIVSLDANGISAAVLGRPIPNTAFLGALATLVDGVAVGDVKEAIRSYMPARLHEKNERIVDEAAARLAAADKTCFSTAGATFMSPPQEPEAHPNLAPATPAPAPPSAADDVWRGCAHIPTLRTHRESPPSLDPRDFARSTCYEAGHLVSKNSGWRNARPIVDAEKCTSCMQCYLQCPDGCVIPPDRAGRPGRPDERAGRSRPAGAVSIDLDFCKGCGICVRACRFDALHMTPESEAVSR